MKVSVWVLCLYALYFAVAFAARTLIHVRRTGANPLKRPHAKIFSREWTAAMLLGIGAGLGLLAPVLDLIGLSEPIPALDAPPGHAAGFALFAIGLLLMFWSQMTMGPSWRIGVDASERTELVTRGHFIIVRNPIYAAGFLMSLGLFLVLPTALMAASLLLLVVGVEVQVRAVEEPWLSTVHGSRYAQYIASVGRFFPGLGRSRVSL